MPPSVSPSVPDPAGRPVRTRWTAAGKCFRDGDTGEAVFVKAVTWGPFPPGEEPDPAVEWPRLRDELGANALRVYETPDRAFLDGCASVGLRVFVGFEWTQHVDFLGDRRVFREARERFRAAAARFRGHPAVAGWLVANEIPAPLVRWMGPRRVNRALEALLRAGREGDPEALFAYANYPSTEYLGPRGQDFAAFNLYLEDRDAFARYLRRLQHQAGNLPLLLAETGLDAGSHGEDGQARALTWQVEEAARAGAAGVALFAWSDRWFRGGGRVTGWQFGLTRSDGSARPGLEAVARVWRDWRHPADALAGLAFPRPRMSIVVCTYRGAGLLRPCLESFRRLRYPDREVIVVNDGGDPAVEALVAAFPEVRLVPRRPHGGLSAARNAGARAATGEIVVYTDDDCEADPDWLAWMAHAFASGGFAAVGGPNVPPPPVSRLRAMVAAAPGGPAHVLIDDVSAEHLPGCNLAVRREVIESMGGFDERFWTAGDDVDFCWRLIAAGHRIGFHPAAMVWHHRRFTVRAYLKQQLGYGRAEAMLIPLYPDRFGLRGGARWRGRVYLDPPALRLAASGSRIYHGHRGLAPFQALYGEGTAFSPAALALEGLWVVAALAGVAGGIGFGIWPFWAMGVGMLVFSGARSVVQARRAALDPRFDGFPARAGLAALTLIQGPLRSLRRWGGVWRVEPRRPAPPGPAPERKGPPRSGGAARLRLGGPGQTLAYWSERPVDRGEWLDRMHGAAIAAGLRPCPVPETGEADLEFRTPAGLVHQMAAVTEYHEGGRSLLRIRRRMFFPLAWLLPLLASAACLAAGLRFESWSLAGKGFLIAAVSALALARPILAMRNLMQATARDLGLTRL